MVRIKGLEPSRSCDHWYLKPARLPIPPYPHNLHIPLHTKDWQSSIKGRILTQMATHSLEPEASTLPHLATLEATALANSDAPPDWSHSSELPNVTENVTSRKCFTRKVRPSPAFHLRGAA